MTSLYSRFIIRAYWNLCASTATSRKFSIQTVHDRVNNAVTPGSKEFLSCCNDAPLLIPRDFWRRQKASSFLYAKFHVVIYFPFFFFFFVPRWHYRQSRAVADSYFGSWRRHWQSTGHSLSFIHFLFPERCCWMQVSLFSLGGGWRVAGEQQR